MSRRQQLHQRWYRLLLLAYPRAWRHEHGAEIRTTLLEASQTQPGQRPPEPRQAASLLMGGLRTRARMAAVGSAGRLWQGGLHLGALLLLLGQAAAALHMQWAQMAWGRADHASFPPNPLALLPILGAVSVLRGRWRSGLVLTALTAAAAFSPAAGDIGAIDVSSWEMAARYLLPVAIVGLLAWRPPPRQPRSWLWLLVPVLMAVDAATSGAVFGGTGGGRVTWLLLPVLLAGVLLLVPADPRPAIAATVFLAPFLVATLDLSRAIRQPIIGVLLWGGGTLALLLAAVWGTRRLTRA
jgi:hypothetical protein